MRKFRHKQMTAAQRVGMFDRTARHYGWLQVQTIHTDADTRYERKSIIYSHPQHPGHRLEVAAYSQPFTEEMWRHDIPDRGRHLKQVAAGHSVFTLQRHIGKL